MLVLKFKGAVLQNPEMLADVKKNINSLNSPCIIVVSALKGVMPGLRSLYKKSLQKGSGFEEEFQLLKAGHLELAARLLSVDKMEEYRSEAGVHFQELYDILHQVAVLKATAHYMKDYILSKGDILASLLFSKLFENACWRDSRDFIVTNNNFGAPEILWEESCQAAGAVFKDMEGIAVVPGYCGKTGSGDTISLGRVGLALTASVLDAAFHPLNVA